MSDGNGALRIVIADDQVLVRAGFSVLIGTAPDMLVVGEAGDGRRAVELCRTLQPDVVLMDIRMPVLDGIEATRLIGEDAGREGATPPKIIILTTFDLDEHVVDAVRHGASGFLLKDTTPEALLDGIRTVAAGEAMLSPRVTRTLIDTVARLAALGLDPPRPLPELTPRETDVLVLVARGLSNQQIGAHLHISPGTTKTHVGRLLSKLDARDRAQLVIAAYESGLVHPSR